MYITGIVASGKTTLAKRLSKELQVPFYELDGIVHAVEGNVGYKRTPEEQAAIIREINKGKDWIIEGTYRKSCGCLLELADTILFLDPPLRIRKIRILRRHIRQKLGIEKCSYKPDLKMLRLMYRWTRDFEGNRPDFEAMLSGYTDKLIKVRDPEEAYNMLTSQNE